MLGYDAAVLSKTEMIAGFRDTDLAINKHLPDVEL